MLPSRSSLGHPGFLLDIPCPALRLSTVLQMECLGCDCSTGALAIPVLGRAVSGHGSISLLLQECSEVVGRESCRAGLLSAVRNPWVLLAPSVLK